jgi:hypothetical protein
MEHIPDMRTKCGYGGRKEAMAAEIASENTGSMMAILHL